MSSSAASAISWKDVRGVIFDVDGTLYAQRPVRLRMSAELLRHALLDLAWTDLRIVHRFRRLREELADAGAENVGDVQYILVAEELSVSRDRVAAVTHDWMEDKPLRYLRAARLPGVAEFFGQLRRQGVRIGVLSDYPVTAKLAALELDANATCSSAEPEVGRLKPHPAGLNVLLRRLMLEPRECIMIGDRIERDGACAAALGMPFLLCDNPSFYVELLVHQQHAVNCQALG